MIFFKKNKLLQFCFTFIHPSLSFNKQTSIKLDSLILKRIDPKRKVCYKRNTVSEHLILQEAEESYAIINHTTRRTNLHFFYSETNTENKIKFVIFKRF